MNIKQKYILALILFVILLISIIVAVVNYSSADLKQNKLLDLSKLNTYDSTLLITLPKLIQETASIKNLRGYVESINTINGDDYSINSLKNEINMALTEYKKWTVKVDENTEAGILASQKRRLSKFKDLYVEQVYSNLRRQAKRQANYSIQAYYSKEKLIETEVSNDVKITLKVADLRNETILFTIMIEFIHPQTLQALQKVNTDIKKQNLIYKEDRINAKKRMDTSIIIIILIILSVFVYLLKRYWTKLENFILNRQRMKQLCLDIERREDYFIDGHYVTLLELLNNYLEFFPHALDIKAFKERLLDFTNNDPKKSQVAFVEIAKLKNMTHVNSVGNVISLLPPAKQDELLKLSEYNPDLKQLYNKVLAIEDKRGKDDFLRKKITELEKLCTNGNLDIATEQATTLYNEHPDNYKIEEILDDITKQAESAKEDFYTAQELLKVGNIKEAFSRLKLAISKYTEYPKAVELFESLNVNKNKTRYILENTNGTEFKLFCGSQAVLGREGNNVRPDIVIDNRQVSRNHLNIDFIGNKIEIKDNDSAGGSFINGTKITSSILNDKDELNIAKVLNYDVKVHKGNNSTPDGLLLYNNNQIFCVLNKTMCFGFNENRVNDNFENISLFFEESILIMLINDKVIIPKLGESITLDNSEFTIKDIL